MFSNGGMAMASHQPKDIDVKKPQWRRKMLAAVLAACPGLANAHDFWLQPNAYRLESPATTALTLQVGHGPARQRSPMPMRRIARFDGVTPQGRVVDLRKSLHLGDEADDGSIRLTDSGTHLLVLESDDRAQSHLPSIRFNDYLQAEGLTPALDERQRTARSGRDGSERYRRCTKALVQVGPEGGDALAVTQAQGMELEIVPQANPYARPRPRALTVRVLYEGRPLPASLVKMTDLDHDVEPFEVHRTDAEGRATFTMPDRGRWMLNVVWTKVLAPTEETDFATVFSSLSFGF